MQVQTAKKLPKLSDKPTGDQPRKTGTDTVTVICKIPQGIILQLHELRKVREVAPQGYREVEQYFPVEEPIEINGPAHGQNEGPRHLAYNGFAVTTGVPKDIWDRWMEETGKHLPAVKNGLLQAFSDKPHAADAAKENRAAKTGLERINPNKLPNIDPRFNLKTAKEQKAKISHVEE